MKRFIGAMLGLAMVGGTMALVAADGRAAEKEELFLPPGARGFRGMLLGTITNKAEARFVLKVEKVLRLWPKNQAENPQALVGKEVGMVVPPKAERILAALKELKVGDRVVAEGIHEEGNFLFCIETLRKAEGEGGGEAPPPGGELAELKETVARLRARVAELEEKVAALQKEVAHLRELLEQRSR